MQDSWKQLKSDSISWQRTLISSHNVQNLWHVVSTLCHEMKNSTDRKGWIRGNIKIGPVLDVTTSYLQGKYGVEIRIESVSKDNSLSWLRISHGLNKLVTDLIDKEYDDNEQETVERICIKNECTCFLQADQRLKQKHEDLPLLAHLQELYLFLKEYGLTLNQELNRISRTQWQKDWLLFFVMVIYLENKMLRLNSGDYKIIFGTILRTLSIGLMKSGRARCKEAEATRKDFNIVLIRQDKKFFTSELFKVIQDAIPLILHYRTTW